MMGGYLYKSPATSQRAHYAIELLPVPPDVTTSTFNTNDCTMRHHRLSGKNRCIHLKNILQSLLRRLAVIICRIAIICTTHRWTLDLTYGERCSVVINS